MPQSVWEHVQALLQLGRDVGNVDVVPMALRTIVIYVLTLAIVRFGSTRFLSEATAFDVIVSIMLGSVMSRAINSSAPLLPTLLGGAVLIGLHTLLALLAFHLDWFGPIVKGNRILLIKDGEVQKKGLRRANISVHDLDQSLRLQANETDPAQIELAYLERNGRISVIPSKQGPRILEVSVADGVQTVRIQLE